MQKSADFRLIRNSKAVSEIITVLLLILLTVALFSIIAVFVIPYVRDSLDNSKLCYDTLGKVEITNDVTTCFNRSNNETGISIKRGDVEISGILVGLKAQGSSKSFRIFPERYEEVRMFVKDYNETLELPGKNEERTYVFNPGFKVEKAVVAPIVGDKTCKESEEVRILSC
jgi:flagellin-like protein